MQFQEIKLRLKGHYRNQIMKKLFIAAAGIAAASLLSSNAFAFSGGYAEGIAAGESAVKVHYRHCCHCNASAHFGCGGNPYYFDRCHHFRLCHYPYPNIRSRGADCCCSLLWPF
jgi:hypothetical protein